MTDMKISDGAVIEAVKAHHRAAAFVTPASVEIRAQIRMTEAVAAALRYYAAHPDELPQEVRDAVRRMDRDKPSETHWM